MILYSLFSITNRFNSTANIITYADVFNPFSVNLWQMESPKYLQEQEWH